MYRDPEKGDWRGLGADSQSPRYSAIVDMLGGIEAGCRVLDVGCGEGVLRSWLPDDIRYIGIDPSDAAVALAQEKFPLDEFHCVPAEEFSLPQGHLDLVVFNEMLYYTRNPVGVVERYQSFLAPAGKMLISVYQKPGVVPIRRRILRALGIRRAVSNRHTEEIVRDFMMRDGCEVIDDRTVPVPNVEANWNIWLSRF